MTELEIDPMMAAPGVPRLPAGVIDGGADAWARPPDPAGSELVDQAVAEPPAIAPAAETRSRVLQHRRICTSC